MSNTEYLNYGKNIKKTRVDLGLTMHGFGQALTCSERSEQVVYSLERSQDPCLGALIDLLNYFELPLNNILDPEKTVLQSHPHYDVQYFAKNLVVAMDAKEMTCKAISAKTGISLSSIKSYRTGRRTPKLSYLIRLSDALGVTADSLIQHSAPSSLSASSNFPPE